MATKNSAGAKAAATKAANKAAAAAAAEKETAAPAAPAVTKATKAPVKEVKLKAAPEPEPEAVTEGDENEPEVETADSATRNHVADDIRERLRLEGIGVSEKVAKAMVKAFEASVVGYLAAGTEINFPGFGKFKLSPREARESRNPRTGDIIQVPATLVASFKVGSTIKAAAQEAFEGLENVTA